MEGGQGCTAARRRGWPRAARWWHALRAVRRIEIPMKEIPMNANQIKGEWKVVRGKVAEQWGKLTDNDLEVIAGKRDQLVGLLQKRYGKAQEVIEREVKEFEAR